MILKKLLLFVALILLGTSVRANAISEREFIRQNFPTFEQVFTHIVMELDYACDDCYYGIAKKPQGYYLTATPFNKDEPTKFTLVWDRNTANFIDFDPSDFSSTQKIGIEPPEEFKVNYQQANAYDFYLYYGYEGWIEDTRSLLGQYSDKTAEDLEILARSYANEATEAAHPGITQNYVDLSMLFEDKGFAKAGDTQIRFFEEATNKAISYWKELQRKNPNHKTLNGDAISLKLSSEYMHFYQLAQSIQANALASTFAKSLYYDQSWVQFSKNLLDACETDGILFTSGSSDTYPLLYAQEKLGIREDVIIINTSLLNTSWYWQMIQETSGLNTSIKAKQFLMLKDKPIFVDPKAEPAPFKQWLEKLLQEETARTYRLAPPELFLSYQGANLNLPLKTQQLTVSDLIQIDLLSNNANRSFFTSSPYGMVSIGLYYNLAPTGRAFSLVGDRIAAMEELKTIQNIENLAFYSTADYLDAIGTHAENEFSMLSYLVMNISPVFQDRKDDLVAKLYKQLPPKEMVNTEDFALLDALNAFYEMMLPEASEELRTYLQPLAEDLILNTSVLHKNLSDDIDKIEQLFSIYAHFRVYETPNWADNFDERPSLSDLEKEVLSQIQSKALNIASSQALLQQDINKRKATRLLRALEYLDLE